MFAGLPPPSSELTERKSAVPHLLLQIGGANIAYLIARSARCDVRWVAANFVVARSCNRPLINWP
jgi:hypothetical protein